MNENPGASAPRSTTTDYAKIEDLVETLLAMSAAERAERLETLAAQEPAIVGRVRALLQADEHLQTGGFMADSIAATAAGDLAGRTIGPYQLIEEIGRGGMGVVYLAERSDVGK
ncbi:MAG: hypothetical protein AAFX41_18295, partial [Bacteroidota bacterium]